MKLKIAKKIMECDEYPNAIFQQLQGHYIEYGQKFFEFPPEFEVKINSEIIYYYNMNGKKFLEHSFEEDNFYIVSCLLKLASKLTDQLNPEK